MDPRKPSKSSKHSKPTARKNKEKKKQKWKERKKNTVQKDKPSCTRCKKDGHDDEHYWSLHSELKPKKFGGKKKKIVDVVQKDSNSLKFSALTFE